MRTLPGAALLALSSNVLAHQPVMDMAPRWDGGYGAQTRIERFNNETTTWLEGVYTFQRAIRVTVKAPYRHGRLGNIIVGMPLKKYHNDGDFTSNWSVTPSVQLATGNPGDSDVGLSVSYSAESPHAYQLYDLYAWQDSVGFDANFGIVKTRADGGGLFALWDVSVLFSPLGDRVMSGPVAMYFRGNMILRAEYKALIFERDSTWDSGFLSVGLGIVF